MRDDLDWFASKLEDFNLSAEQLSALFNHYETLRRWNRKLNLTSITDPDEIVTRHYRESLFFGAHLPDAPPGTTIADIGSGAGFPGIPMAVLRFDWQIALIESHQRKAVFLRETTRAMQNVHVIADRAERVDQQFDWIVSRAVAPEDVLALIPKLAHRAGLLMGPADFDRLQREPSYIWSIPLQIPGGVAAFVSRGT